MHNSRGKTQVAASLTQHGGEGAQGIIEVVDLAVGGAVGALDAVLGDLHASSTAVAGLPVVVVRWWGLFVRECVCGGGGGGRPLPVSTPRTLQLA